MSVAYWFQSLIGIIGYFEKISELSIGRGVKFQSLIGIIGYFELGEGFPNLHFTFVSIPNRDYRLFRVVFRIFTIEFL